MRSQAAMLRTCLGFLIVSLSMWPIYLAATLLNREAIPAILAFISAGSLIAVALFSIDAGTKSSASEPLADELRADVRRLRHLLIASGALGLIMSIEVQRDHWPQPEWVAYGCTWSSLVVVLVGLEVFQPAFCATPPPDHWFELEPEIVEEEFTDTICAIPDPQLDRLLLIKRRLKERGYR
jgi:hypothetical protein